MDNNQTIIPVERYRKLLNDYTSTDERVAERLQYLETLCRNVIQTELDKYSKQKEL